MSDIDIRLFLTPDEAWSLAQLIKRLSGRDLGTSAGGLGLVTSAEEESAKNALRTAERALSELGFSPR